MSRFQLLKAATTAALAVALGCFCPPLTMAAEPIEREVKVVHARKSCIERTTTVPCSLIAEQSARLYAKVSGYLKELNVDIGDEVKAGDVLAVIEVPQLAAKVKRDAAVFKEAQSKVLQAEARLASAQADRVAAEARLAKDRACLTHEETVLDFQKQIYESAKSVGAERAIEQRAIDEQLEERQASIVPVDAAKSEIRSAEADWVAANARIHAASAGIKAAEANVNARQSTWKRSQVMLDYATIRAPFSGAITERNFFVGDLIRAAGSQDQRPLLSLQTTERLRAVVQVSERDVLYVHPGEPAVVQFDTLPGRRLQGKISRVAKCETAEFRPMRAEIDLDNTDDELLIGMRGKATLYLHSFSNELLLSSQCLAERTQKGKAAVFVVRDGRLRKVDVRVGADNAVDAEILSGLTTAELVVLRPSPDLRDRDRVIVRK